MTTTINSRTTVHRGRVFTLVRENVTLENGTITDVEFIEHPGAAAIIPMLSDTRVVLLKQYRHALKNYIWEIPAGTLDPAEDVIAYCRIGERSSHTWFVLTQLLGFPSVRNYDGSWTEWGNVVGAPIERP